MSETTHSKVPFTVVVRGGFTEDGVWLIGARLRFRGDVPRLDEALLGQVRLALKQGIIREGRRGEQLGAAEVRLSMDAPVPPEELGLDKLPVPLS